MLFGCLGMLVFGIMFFSGIDDNPVMAWIGFLGFVVSSFAGNSINSKRKRNLANKLTDDIGIILKELPDFTASQKFFSPNMDGMIAIDEKNKKVCIIENKYENSQILSKTFNKYDYEHNVIDFQDIIQSEILLDDRTITTTSRGSQLGGAVIGGVLAGGVGAVIGGLSGSSEATTEIKKITLQIVVNNIKKSYHRVNFISLDTPFTKDSVLYKNANKEITHWHNVLSHIINRADKEESAAIDSSPASNHSLADELKKLDELRISGILTTEEFNQQKQKLMSK